MHVLNQLFSQKKVQSVKHLTTQWFEQSVSNCSRKKTFYGGRVVAKNEMHGDVPVSDMHFVYRKR